MSSESLLEEKILQVLNQKTYKATLDIAKEVFGTDGKASNVNPALYQLLKKKLVKKKCNENGSKPQWRRRSTTKKEKEKKKDAKDTEENVKIKDE